MSYKDNISPPKWAERFLRFYCRKEFLEEIQGDVCEIFEVNLKTKGKGHARRRFAWDVFRFLRWSNIKTIKKGQFNSIHMYQNYLKTALRGIKRSKFYAFVNISGLAVAVAVFMLIFLYVKNEMSYDRYHAKSDQIYRVAANLTVPGSYFEFAITPPNLGARMDTDFPEVRDFMRMSRFQGTLTFGDKTFLENYAMYADPSFFRFFDIPLLQGDSETALSAPYSIVLTESAVQKYFQNEEAFGKLIKVDGIEQSFAVTGVMADVPENTHFQSDFLVSMDTRKAQGFMKDTGQWFFIDYFTYLLFDPGYDPVQLQAKLPDFIERNIGDAQRSAKQTYEFKFQKLTDIHLKSHLDGEAKANGDIQYVYIFSIIALFILAIACVNFMNLSTSRASKRAKEIGMRKVVGAVRSQLIGQMLFESILITFFSFIMAVVLVIWALPSFNILVDLQLSISELYQGSMALLWPLMIVAIGCAAGFYPALILSRFKAIKILKSASAASQQNSLLRKSLVVFQLVISTILIIGTLIINGQLKNMQEQNLGFDQETMLVMNFSADPSVLRNMDALRSEFKRNPNVMDVTFSRSSPGLNEAGNWYTEYEVADGEMQNASMYGYLVDYDFIKTYGIEIVAGRGFDKNFATDVNEAFVINEKAVEKMGLTSPEEALGRAFSQFGKPGKVIGVIRDFNFMTLHNAIKPLVLHLTNPQFLEVVSVKLSAGADLSVIENLEEVWNGMIKAVPFEATFMDQALNQRYIAETRTRKVFSSFASLAIFIAALGLLALSTLSAEQQRRNISIKKVLGAPERQIAYRFSMAFVKLAGLALVISIPVAYFAAEAWLSNFSYRIDLDPPIFVLGGAITTMITLLTVSFQSFRITRINPAQNLRSE